MQSNAVRYFAEHYTSTGNTYYYKQHFIRDGKESYWGAKREITEDTYQKAKKQGKSCTYTEINKPLAQVIQFGMIPVYLKISREKKAHSM